MARYDLKAKTALVTGAGSGIGREIARALAAKGANVIAMALPAEAGVLEALAAELNQNHGVEAWPLTGDLSTPEGPRELYKQVGGITPRLDILVNNAGVLFYGFFDETELAKSEMILQVNAQAYMALMALFLPQMKAAGTGRVLNVCSASAFQPTPHHTVYGATKAFVQMLSEGVRQELSGTGVKVCTLNPSYVNTPLLKGEDMPGKLRWYSIGGLADPASIAQAAARTIEKGKAVNIPGLQNKIVHLLLPRIMPRRLMPLISIIALKGSD